MKLANPFPENVRLIYLYVYACFECGRSDRGLELHHITGRDSLSAFNACPLCKVCHNAIIHTNYEERKYFRINKDFLLKQHYQPIEYDFEFIRDHPYLVVEN